MSKFTPGVKTGRDRISLNWTQINAIISGVSAIDQGSLAIRNHQEAVRFAREYGFNIKDSHDVEHLVRVHREAVDFIDEFFLIPEQAPLVAEDVRHPEDVLDL